MNTKHTAEPWVYNDGFILGRFHSDGEVHDICDPRCAPAETCGPEMDANTDRIVQCVNACAGIQQPQSVILRLRQLRKRIEAGEEFCGDGDLLGELTKALQALGN